MRALKAGLIGCLILAVLLCTLPVLGELSYTDAKEIIKLHNQYQNYRSTGGLRDGAQGYYDARNFQIQNGKYWCWWDGVYGVDCLEQGGCHAFAYSHAVQWLLQQKLGDGVLHELIDACENPSDYCMYHSYPKCKASAYPHKTSSEAYARLCVEKYGLTASADDALDRCEEEWTAFFDAGRIAVLLVDGHYNVAVDYLDYEGTTYVQILDSAPNASVTRTWGTAYMVYKNEKIYRIGTPAFGIGPYQYWVAMADFLENYISVDRTLTGGNWEGHAQSGS